MFAPFHEVVSDPLATVRKHHERSGRPVIGVMPAYFPLELIHAAGGYPVQFWGAGLSIEHADAYLPSYCCSVARSLLELEMRALAAEVQAYAFTSLCDTLINLREIYRRLFGKPTFGFSIPVTPSPEARKVFLSTIIAGVVKGIEELTGGRPGAQALQASAALYGRVRGLQRQLYGIRRRKPGMLKNADFYAAIQAGFFLPAEDYCRLLERLVAELKTLQPCGQRLPRLVLSGMVFEPFVMHAVLDGLQAHVVDDDFANGWRSASKGELQVDDWIAGTADYLFGGAPCCCLHNPQNDRHTYLIEKVKTADADGVLFWAMRFCEPDAFDRPQLARRLRQEGIPSFTLEMDLATSNFQPAKTRVEAFLEMIGGLEA
jgi:bcr-type benzoyl-CoA reductase subunit C